MDPNSVPIQTPQRPGMNGSNNNTGTTPNSYRHQPFHADLVHGKDGSQFGAHHGIPPSPWGGTYMAPPTPMPGRFTPWSEDKVAMMQARLAKRLGPEYVATRPGPGGGPKLSYIEAWKVINLANEVFGFNGWSSSITSLKTDFLDVNPQDRCWIGITAIVRVTLQDGCYHEDLGYGHAENVKGKAAALEKAQKEAVTDGIKRALKHFGNVLGNCLYDKEFTKEVAKIRVGPAKFNVDELERRPEFTPQGAPARAAAGPQLASAVPQHVSGAMKPPAPPPPRFNAAPERAETPLRALDENNDINMDDSEFGYLEAESFLSDLDESVLASKAGGNAPMLVDKPPAPAAAATTNAPVYQHRHRPDMPQEPQAQLASAKPFVRNTSSSSESSSASNDADPKAPKRTVGGFAVPNGGASTSTTATGAASRRAAMMAAISAGSASNTDKSPIRAQSPRIPSGGVEAVAVRAQSNLRAHGANLEIEASEQVDVKAVKYGQFTSARGVKREGSQSPTKWDGRTRVAGGRSALAEVPVQSEADGSEWKRSRLSM